MQKQGLRKKKNQEHTLRPELSFVVALYISKNTALHGIEQKRSLTGHGWITIEAVEWTERQCECLIGCGVGVSLLWLWSVLCVSRLGAIIPG